MVRKYGDIGSTGFSGNVRTLEPYSKRIPLMTLALITPITLAAIMITGASTTAAMAASSAEEINAALVGNTFKGSMGSDVYSSYFAKDGTYEDAYGGGNHEITDEGVCYPDTDYGCYAADIKGDQLEWFQEGKSLGTGVIEQGNTLN